MIKLENKQINFTQRRESGWRQKWRERKRGEAFIVRFHCITCWNIQSTVALKETWEITKNRLWRRLRGLVANALWSTHRLLCKGTPSAIMLTAWWIWKHCKAAVFDNAQPSMASLLDTIKAEARSWAQAGLGAFTSCSPRLLSGFSCMVRCWSIFMDLYKNYLFYQCIKTQCFLCFWEKKQAILSDVSSNRIKFHVSKKCDNSFLSCFQQSKLQCR
jgi:hypothetical protein